MIKIRKAVKEDCAAIMKLVHELAIYEKAPEAVTVSMEHFMESGFGEKPVWEAFVATSPLPSPQSDEGETSEVIGFALYYIRYSTWKGQRMYLEDLLVTDAMRGKSVGKLLFDTLIEECKTKKYSGLVWQVLDWNEPAINFYKKFEGVKFDGEWVNCSMEF
jgi:GNAT superfamily N-acetyltransferase